MIHLNIGAGTMPLPDHINCDSQPYPGIDRVFRCPPIPFEDGEVESIYAGHFLEHLPPQDTAPFLAECRRVLRVGGSLTLVVPDAEKARLLLESKRLIADHFAPIVMGDRHDDMPHRTIWRRAWLEDALMGAGFELDAEYRWKDDPRVFDTAPIWQAGARGVRR